MLHSRRSVAARPHTGSSRAPALALLLVAAAVPAGVAAAPPATPSAARSASAPSKASNAPEAATRSNTGPGGKKVISLDDEFLVEGQLEKPSAFYVLQRSSTDYDWARLDASMTPLVLESVWDPLF